MEIEAWNEALFHEVVESGNPDDRLYLYVDRGVLSQASGLADDEAAEDFCSAFAAYRSRQPFERPLREAASWKARGWPGRPPCIAALAMTVLAVTDDPVGNPQGVYRTQNTLLELPPEAVEPPGYDVHVPALWQIWNQWLEGPGRRYGRPSARTHERWSRQGWARSQALIRFNDRLLIEDFLDGLRVGAKEREHVDLLLDDFLAWLRYRGNRGARLVEKVSDEPARVVLREVLEDELNRWAGGQRRRRSLASHIQGLLSYDPWLRQFAVVVPVDERLHGRAVTVAGETFHVDEFTPYVTVPLDEPESDVLRRGLQASLAEGLRVRFSSDLAYVFRDEPLVDGLLQVRGAASSAAYRVLVSEDHAEAVRRALTVESGAPAKEPAHVPGWIWLTCPANIADSADLRVLGLGSLAQPEPDVLSLHGGLAVGPRSYLVGHEPDVVIPAGKVVTLDGRSIDVAGEDEDRIVALSDQVLDPGAHAISANDGASLRFTTLTHATEVARSSHITAPLGAGAQLSGLRLIGVSAPQPLTIKAVQGREYLAILSTGEVREVWPQAEPWVETLGLQTVGLDVQRLLRGMLSDCAFILVRNPRNGTIEATHISGCTDRIPGTVPYRQRTDLAAHLLTSWKWIGSPADARRKEVLNRMLREGALTAPKRAGAPKPPSLPRERDDLVGGPLQENAYDDVLLWLSEREDGTASMDDFKKVWQWCCERRGMPELALQERLALMRMERLGYIERDWKRRRVGVADSSLVDLPAANGLCLLTGARPQRLIERLLDDQDRDEAVAELAMSIDVMQRTQLDERGRPLAPTSVYLSYDPTSVELVRAGFKRLGVEVAGIASVAITHHHPSLKSSLADGLSFSSSPSTKFRRRSQDRDGRTFWSERVNDLKWGLYEYIRPQGSSFAWRDESGTLTAVERQMGVWIDEHAHQRVRHIKHSALGRQLAVPCGRGLGLPPILERALIARSGLLPRRVPPLEVSGLRRQSHWVFENIDATTAEQVGTLLGQELQDISEAIKVEK